MVDTPNPGALGAPGTVTVVALETWPEEGDLGVMVAVLQAMEVDTIPTDAVGEGAMSQIPPLVLLRHRSAEWFLGNLLVLVMPAGCQVRAHCHSEELKLLFCPVVALLLLPSTCAVASLLRCFRRKAFGQT